VALPATLLTFLIFLWAIVTSVLSAAATLALLRFCAVCRSMACVTAVETFLLANGTLLLLARLASRLVA